MTPVVSIVVPAYRAQTTIRRTLASVAFCGLERSAVEIVIASDDGYDYAALLGRPDHIRYAPVGSVRTGAGAARNRALAEARGRYVAFLDADDSWETGYLADLLPLAEACGVAFGQTRILLGERAILRLPGVARLDFDALAVSGASFHPVVRRDWAGPFSGRAAQDIFHTVEVLALAGGWAPIGGPAYEIHLSDESFTAGDGFSQWVDRDYRDYEADIRAGRSRVPDRHRRAAADVFVAKRRLNADYSREGGSESYYGYVAKRLPRCDCAGAEARDVAVV